MKLIIAILRDEDGHKCMLALNKKGFSVTKLATTGGFLRAGNMTLLVGTDDDRVEDVISILKSKCQSREQVVSTPVSASISGAYTPRPVEVEIGGATIFVVSVERFEKL